MGVPRLNLPLKTSKRSCANTSRCQSSSSSTSSAADFAILRASSYSPGAQRVVVGECPDWQLKGGLNPRKPVRPSVENTFVALHMAEQRVERHVMSQRMAPLQVVHLVVLLDMAAHKFLRGLRDVFLNAVDAFLQPVEVLRHNAPLRFLLPLACFQLLPVPSVHRVQLALNLVRQLLEDLPNVRLYNFGRIVDFSCDAFQQHLRVRVRGCLLAAT